MPSLVSWMISSPPMCCLPRRICNNLLNALNSSDIEQVSACNTSSDSTLILKSLLVLEPRPTPAFQVSIRRWQHRWSGRRLESLQTRRTRATIASYTDHLTRGAFQPTLEKKQNLYQLMGTLGFPWNWDKTWWAFGPIQRCESNSRAWIVRDVRRMCRRMSMHCMRPWLVSCHRISICRLGGNRSTWQLWWRAGSGGSTLTPLAFGMLFHSSASFFLSCSIFLSFVMFDIRTGSDRLGYCWLFHPTLHCRRKAYSHGARQHAIRLKPLR